MRLLLRHGLRKHWSLSRVLRVLRSPSRCDGCFVPFKWYFNALTRGDTPHLPIAVGRGPDRYSRQIFRPEHPSRDECWGVVLEGCCDTSLYRGGPQGNAPHYSTGPTPAARSSTTVTHPASRSSLTVHAPVCLSVHTPVGLAADNGKQTCDLSDELGLRHVLISWCNSQDSILMLWSHIKNYIKL